MFVCVSIEFFISVRIIISGEAWGLGITKYSPFRCNLKKPLQAVLIFKRGKIAVATLGELV